MEAGSRREFLKYLASVDNVEATTEMLVAKHPLGRIATADDVACDALFLASDRASFITGGVAAHRRRLPPGQMNVP